MMKVVGAVAAMMVVAGIIVAVGMWRGLIRAFRDLMDLAQEEFEDETGIDFETGVMPWVGPEFAVGVLEADWNREEWVVAGMVGVRHEDSAEAFFRDWLEYMEDEHYTEFHDETYGDFDIVVSEDGEQAYALTHDWLVFASSERGLEDVLTRLAGDEEDSLASSEEFIEARSQLTERRFASAYFSLVEAQDFFEDAWNERSGPAGTNWVAASAGVVEAGVVIEVAAPVGIGYPLELADLDDPSKLLSDDTLGFVAATFDPDVDHWRGALRRYEIGDFLAPDEIDGLNEIVEAFANELGALSAVGLDDDDGLDVLLDLGLSVAEVTTGIDLEDDLFDHLGGEIIMAVGDVDFDESLENLETVAIEAVGMVSYRDGRKDELADTIDEAVERFASFADLDTDTRDVGADERAVLFDLGALSDGGDDYRPGYVFHGGYLTLGSTERALEGVVRRQNGDADGLSGDEEYQRALGLLPEKRQFLGYVDLHRIIRQLDAEDFDLSRDQHRVLEESVGALAMSSYSPHCGESSEPFECELPAGADVSRYTVVLTLFPE